MGVGCAPARAPWRAAAARQSSAWQHQQPHVRRWWRCAAPARSPRRCAAPAVACTRPGRQQVRHRGSRGSERAAAARGSGGQHRKQPAPLHNPIISHPPQSRHPCRWRRSRSSPAPSPPPRRRRPAPAPMSALTGSKHGACLPLTALVKIPSHGNILRARAAAAYARSSRAPHRPGARAAPLTQPPPFSLWFIIAHCIVLLQPQVPGRDPGQPAC